MNSRFKYTCHIITLLLSVSAFGQIPYGNNPDAGKYIQAEDAKIYYEVYGEGDPLLLIHGSLYGYIDEFQDVLPELAKDFKVVAVALRGHGKSEIGKQDYNYRLFSEDLIRVLNAEKIDKFSILGFSAGAITALRIATDHPSRVTKVVSLAGGLGIQDVKAEELENEMKTNGQQFIKDMKEFVDERKKLMPEPNRFVEFYEKLKVAHIEPIWVSDEEASTIKAEVLVVGGDRDEYFKVTAFLRTFSLIHGSRLLILPKSGHVDVLLNKAVYLEYAIPFLKTD